MKATSILGGVQVFNIIINIIRSKVMALLLGPSGIGINALLNSTIQLIERFSSFGLKTSAVKNVAQAHATLNTNKVNEIVTILRKLVWVTGLIGTVLTIVLSPLLSQLAFGSEEKTFAFILVAVSLLFNQLCSGQLVILQGLRKIKYLARASMAGTLFALILTLPLYLFWGVDGIVPAIVGTSVARMLISWHYANKTTISTVGVTKMEAIKQSKDMLSMGVMLTLSGLIGNGSAYLLRVFISATGGLSQVGLYTAGFAIINTYVGLIFSAMATDYFPRLSEVAHSKSKLRETISQQSEIAILILAPILTIFIIFSKWIITILYSSEFIGVAGMIQWASLGMLFKATSWAIAYLFLAKGVSVLFFFNELISSVYVLGFNIIGYKYGGLEGVGISFIFGYLIYLTQVYFLTHFKFSFNFNKKLVRIFFLQFVLIIASFLIINLFNGLYILVGGVIIISFSSAYSIYELDKRVGIRGVLFKKLNNA